MSDAAEVLRRSGVDAPAALLAPLLRAALERGLAEEVAGLTGPVSRGDVATVASHVAALEGTAPDVVPVYRALAARTADLVERAGGPLAAPVHAVLDRAGGTA